MEDQQGSGQGPGALQDVFNGWRDDYVERLKELQSLKVETRKWKAEADQETRAFLLSLLETMDSFDNTLETVERALTEEDGKARRIVKSFSLLKKQFMNVMKKFEATPIVVEQDEFIPGMHKATGTEYDPEAPDGTIVRVEKPGFFWRNTILRPAEVVVSTTTPPEEED